MYETLNGHTAKVSKTFFSECVRPLTVYQTEIDFENNGLKTVPAESLNAFLRIQESGQTVDFSQFTPQQITILIALAVILDSQTKDSEDILTEIAEDTEQNRKKTDVVITISELLKICEYPKQRKAEFCEILLNLDNKPFIFEDHEQQRKRKTPAKGIFANLIKINTLKSMNIERKVFNSLSDLEKMQRFRESKKIYISLNPKIFGHFYNNFVAVKKAVFVNLKGMKKSITAKMYVLFLLYSTNTEMYKCMYVHQGGKVNAIPCEVKININRILQQVATLERYKEHPAERNKDFFAACEKLKEIGIFQRYRTDNAGGFYFVLNPELKPHPYKLKGNQQKATNKRRRKTA